MQAREYLVRLEGLSVYGLELPQQAAEQADWHPGRRRELAAKESQHTVHVCYHMVGDV